MTKTKMLAILFLVSMACISSACAQAGNESVYSSASSMLYPYLYGADMNAEEFCRQGQDFIIQVPPGACQPAVVRSDLLEEQNVPVLCNLVGIKVNPLIEIPVIRNIYTVGQVGGNISGIGYYPARAGTAIAYSTALQSSSATLNNLGWVVVTIRQQPVEANMPDYIDANLTARIKYDVKQSFGVGQRDFVLQEVSDADFEMDSDRYSFWRGKGYVRAAKIDENSATIEVYGGNRITPQLVPLKVGGQESNIIYLPGFYCAAGVQLKLDEISYPSVKAKISINGEERIFSKGAKLTELSGCTVNSIVPTISGGNVKILCSSNSYDLNLESRTAIINSEEIKAGNAINLSDKIYLAYIGANETASFIVAAKINSKTDLKYDIDAIEKAVSAIMPNPTTEKLKSGLKAETKLSGISVAVIFNGTSVKLENTNITFDGVKGLESRTLSADEKKNYEKAIEAYKSVANDYGQVQDADGVPFGLKALKEAAALAKTKGQEADEEKLLKQLVNDYNNQNISEEKARLGVLSKQSGTAASVVFTDTRTGEIISAVLDEIMEPTKADIYARILVNGAEMTVGRSETIRNNLIVSDITDKSITVQYTDNEGKIQEASIISNSKKTINDTSIEVKAVYAKKEAKVSVIPFSRNGETVTNFSIRVGIEKRAIQLSPEKMKEQINGTAKLIEGIDKFVTNLGKVVTAGKTTCIATYGILAAKNLLSGEAFARTNVMHGIDGTSGWTEFCKSQVSDKVFKSIDFCYANFSKQIDADVKTISTAIKTTDEAVNNLCKDKSNKDCAKEIAKKINGLENVNLDSLIESGRVGKEDAKQLLLMQNAKDCVDTPQSGEFNLCYGGSKIPSVGKLLNKTITSLIDTSQGMQTGIDMAKAAGSTTPMNFVNPQSTVSTVDITTSIFKNEKNEDATILQTSKGTLLVTLNNFGDHYEVVNAYSFNADKILSAALDKTSKDVWPEEISRVRIKKADWKPFASNAEIKLNFFESGKRTGLPYVVPFTSKNGAGFYVLMASTDYDDSGAPNYISVYSAGDNGRIDFGQTDDILYIRTMVSQIPTLEGEQKEIVEKAQNLVRSAASQYQSSKIFGIINLDGKQIQVGDAAVELPNIQCQSFMSPSDCKIIFNVCDPFMCPSSRCNLGGAYQVKDVTQSGILGSLMLCSRNFVGFGGDVFVPICISGIYSSMQYVNTHLKAYQACLQESLDNGRTVGICDEITSVYLCEFIWRESIPLAQKFLPGIITKVLGAVGGGEYLHAVESMNSLTNSMTYFATQYAQTAFNAFNIRSTASIGTDICKNAFSVNYPNSADLLGSFTQPESPAQFYSSFDEIPYSTATYPATSHYKVYYHLYAGEDQGATYSIYLTDNTNPVGMAYSVPIDYGYLSKGQYLSQTKDMLLPSGYRQICVEINLQRECGFGKASTDYAVDYLSDNYLKQQQNTTISTSGQCISGTVSLATPSLLSLNIEEIATSSLQPNLFQKGINRICSKDQPGANWNFIGWCDKTTGVGCWLDSGSVKAAIKDTEIEDQILQNATASTNAYLATLGKYFTDEEAGIKLKEAIAKFKGDNPDYTSIIISFQEIFDKSASFGVKAESMLYIGKSYTKIIEKLAPAVQTKVPVKAPAAAGGAGAGTTVGEKEGKGVVIIPVETKPATGSIIYYTSATSETNEIVIRKFYFLIYQKSIDADALNSWKSQVTNDNNVFKIPITDEETKKLNLMPWGCEDCGKKGFFIVNIQVPAVCGFDNCKKITLKIKKINDWSYNAQPITCEQLSAFKCTQTSEVSTAGTPTTTTAAVVKCAIKSVNWVAQQNAQIKNGTSIGISVIGDSKNCSGLTVDISVSRKLDGTRIFDIIGNVTFKEDFAKTSWTANSFGEHFASAVVGDVQPIISNYPITVTPTSK